MAAHDPHGSNLQGQLLPMDTNQAPLPALVARPGGQGYNRTSRNIDEWLEGLQPSISIQNYRAVQFKSILTFSWLMHVCFVQQHVIPGLIHSNVTCSFQGLLPAG